MGLQSLVHMNIKKKGIFGLKDMSNEDVYLPQVMVAQVHEANDNNIVDGEYWFPNLHDTRYFFSPSAYGLEEGEGYFGHSYLGFMANAIWIVR